MIRYANQIGKLLRSRLVLANQDGADDGRVLHLFRNRAELKKAFGDSQSEAHRLKDRIKLQESATAAVQEQLDGLEAKLAMPVSGLNTLVFYQLRNLWAAGKGLVADLIRDLSQQREEHERRQYIADVNRGSFERLRDARQKYASAELHCADQRAALAVVEQQLAMAKSWWQYFKRRELQQRKQMMSVALHAANAEQAAAREQVREIEQESAPVFPGLSLEARRAINLAAIAYSHLLCVRLAHTGLLARSREAMSRSESKQDGYGESATCLAMMGEITRAIALLRNSSGAANEVGRLSDQLREAARYRSNLDATPSEESVRAAVAAATAKPETVNWDLLRDDVWSITRLMC
jgi:hypothetical protein